ncbi:MBL fold metallo-hydrolase [Gimesia chilikensis]|uniref:Ribonuclease J n=1 Tax=Gimesia chilikensis TaxID=2605989 RepID=A0A517PKF0_9PLAN|nr:MBL fold metallo-hydrolase [Gimesia chilikensis]QDT19854.1 Putative ribonuclease J [Gimesia chilikensis]
MRITVHRGTQEVGGSCIEVSTDNSRIILDIGLPLFDRNRQALDSFKIRKMTKEQLRNEGLLPEVPGLYEGAGEPDAILLSHAHMDHTGLLEHCQSQIPVYASSGTSKMMLAGSLFAAQVGLPRELFREVKPESPVTIGDFTITGFPVDHSIYGCLAFLIEAEGQSILYSGDLRSHGRKPGMNRRLIEVLQKKTIDVMLMEGTHFGFPDGNTKNEYELEEEITELVRESKSLVLASFSPQHVDRLVAFIRAAIKTERTFVADVYTAFIMHLLKNEIKLPQPDPNGVVRVYVPDSLRQPSTPRWRAKQVERFEHAEIKLDEIIKSPERYLMVFRSSMLDDFKEGLPPETCCLYSRWHGYLEQSGWDSTRDAIGQVDGTIREVHTSGHMLSTDIVQLVQNINPQTIIPVHTFEPGRFREHFKNVQLLQDGEPFLVEP